MVYKNQLVAFLRVDGKVLREKEDNVVYLPFGCQYEIQLKNLNSRKAQIKVFIDGQDILYNKALIINPNETQTLTRFVNDLDSGAKFKFIQKTQRISEYRGDRIDDGIIKIEWALEQEKPNTITTTHYHNNYWRIPSHPWYWPYGPQVIYAYTNHTDFIGTKNLNGFADSNLNLNNVNAVMACCSNPLDCSKPLADEGITTKGTISHQKFSYGSIGKLEENSHSIIIRLKGYHNDKQVEKPLMVKESLICDICGTKNSSSHKCCSECGTALEF